MRELSIFIDESGSDNLRANHYLLTLVFHEQSDPLGSSIRIYENSLKDRGLVDIPFHSSPLMNAHDKYSSLSVGERKQLLTAFRVFVRKTPITYTCIRIDIHPEDTREKVTNTMRRELTNFFFDHLEYFQHFDKIKTYYDNGQKSIATAIHDAMGYVFSPDSVTHRLTSAHDYRLSQVADYLCTMELTALKYEENISTKTDEKFFGTRRDFTKGIYKEITQKKLR